MRYPPQFLDRIRQHFRLSEVIGRRLTIRKAGREYHALCPFHNEKSPSFTINDEKAFYHCFGCGAHGDVINFIKEYEGLSWQQAVESLAQEAGLELPRFTPEMREKMGRAEVLFGTVEKSAQWFSQKLRETTGAEARHYLEHRGVMADALATFRIGYAPDTREGLKNHLQSLNIPQRDIEEAGLLSQPEAGASYDKFRGRIIFPIRDISGRVVGFGGRLMGEAGHAPKYLNSPQTALFDKGRLLYNADLARIAVGRSGGTLLVAEGYMDVIALHQAGFTASVAPLGTAVTEDHLRMLWQLADEPVFCLDGDNAGLRAMQRVVNLALPLLKPGKSLRFCLLTKGDDPDSLIKARGAGAMQEAVNNAVPLVDMLWRQEVLEKPHHTPEQRAAAEQSIKRAIEKIQDGTVKRAYLEEVRQRLWKPEKPQAHAGVKKPSSATTSDVASLMATMARAEDAASKRDSCIRTMLSLLSHFPKLLEDREIEAGFVALEPSHPALVTLHETLVAHYMQGELRRERLLAEAGRQEAEAWRGMFWPIGMKKMLAADEHEGLPAAKLAYTKCAMHLLEIQISQDSEEVSIHAVSDHDRERRLMLQQQLERLKALPLLQGDFSH